MHPSARAPHPLRMLRPMLAAALLAACATAPPPAPESAVGRFYHYVRSNQDGTLAEQIYQHRAGATRLEVGKQVAPCTNSAYVTATFDAMRGHGTEFVGGRLARDLSQDAFAWLTYDTPTRTLHASIPPANIDERVAIAGAPFIIYDFDLADLNARFAGAAAPREDFRFAVLLIWPEQGAASIFRDLGWAEARFAGAETHMGRDAVRYDVSGALAGQLWLDAREGHILEARFAQPNHTEYANFRLVLQRVENNGAEAWRAVRAAHWQGCD